MSLTIVSNSPADGAVDVVLRTKITITFSEAVLPASINDDTVVVYSAGSTVYRDIGGSLPYDADSVSDSYLDTDFVEGTLTVTGAIVEFTPDKPFKTNTVYTILVAGFDTSIEDYKYVEATGGDFLSETVRWSFTTGQLDIATPPDSAVPIDYDSLIEAISELEDSSVSSTATVSVSPTNGSYGTIIVNDTLFTFTFDNDVDLSSVDASVYVTDYDDPQRRQYSIPVKFELEGTKILRVKMV